MTLRVLGGFHVTYLKEGNIMVELTTEEQLAIDEFEKVNKAYNDVSAVLEEITLRGVKKYTDAKDIDGAKEYLRLLPESVAKIFVADHIRWARGDYK